MLEYLKSDCGQYIYIGEGGWEAPLSTSYPYGVSVYYVRPLEMFKQFIPPPLLIGDPLSRIDHVNVRNFQRLVGSAAHL